MINIKDHRQTAIFDPWDSLSPMRRWILDESLSGLFREHILNELPVERLSPFFTTGFGRPTKELHTVTGALILQQAFDMTDEETVSQSAFSIQWHYALNITEESDSAFWNRTKRIFHAKKCTIKMAFSFQRKCWF